MATIKGIIVDQSAPGNIRIADLPLPEPLADEALIRVAATSLNRGEIRMAGMGQDGRRIGWDFAGTVEKSAANGSGPPAGARVVGMLASGAWAERIAAPTEALAVLPDTVSFAQAATLPVAGLTALYGLEKGSGLLGRKVLITGGTGGVGHIAIQLARLGGAYVIATARTAERAATVRAAGAHEVVVGEEPSDPWGHGPFDIILDGVGGATLGAASAHLAKNGILVIYGATAGVEVTMNARAFYATGGARIYGFILFHELKSVPASVGLGRLVALVQAGTLRPQIDIEVPLAKIGELAQQLDGRKFTGKAVVTF
jgi:NADPH:quinone reductase-like Zn-dependent oxidoreductase